MSSYIFQTPRSPEQRSVTVLLGSYMTITDYKFSLAEKALLRLQLWELIEHSRAIILKNQGLITIDKKYFALDDGLFEYPFGDVGAAFLEFAAFTEKGHDSYVSIFEEHPQAYKKWKKRDKENPPRNYMNAEQMFCTEARIDYMINAGLRDQLVASSRKTGKEDHYADLYEEGVNF